MEKRFDRLTGSNFKLSIPVLPNKLNISYSNDLSLTIFGNVIPGISLENLEVPWQGGKIIIPGKNITYDPWEISFIVDSDITNWKTLFTWMTMISDNYLEFTGNPKDYVVDSSVNLLDNFGNLTNIITFKNMWIQSLSSVNLSSREGSSSLECTATFYYNRYELRG